MKFGTFREVIKTIKNLPKNNVAENIIYISGGEPLLHPDFDKILEYTYQNFRKINVLTNGLLIPTKLDVLSRFKHKIGVQVSMEGNRDKNNKIRGNGTFDKIMTALNLLQEKNIRRWMSYTVSKINKDVFKDFVNIAIETNCFGNHITPYTGDKELMLSFNEWVDFKYNLLSYAEKCGFFGITSKKSCGFVYLCSEYRNGITVNPDGTFTGCARNQEIKRPYEIMQDYVAHDIKFIHQTCMNKKWKDSYALNQLKQVYMKNKKRIHLTTNSVS
jgi:MoaA/NifB/PqqE/SkfB family radical SAM enzyme